MARRSLLGWLLNLPPPPPCTRLSEDEALAAASTSPEVIALGRPLTIASAQMIENRVMWVVGTGGMGAQSWVEVDDATGLVGELRHFHGR